MSNLIHLPFHSLLCDRVAASLPAATRDRRTLTPTYSARYCHQLHLSVQSVLSACPNNLACRRPDCVLNFSSLSFHHEYSCARSAWTSATPLRASGAGPTQHHDYPVCHNTITDQASHARQTDQLRQASPQTIRTLINRFHDMLHSKTFRKSARDGGDLPCIFIHAGAGYHSIQNERIHLQACNESVACR